MNETISLQRFAASHEDFPIHSLLGVKGPLLIRGYSFYSSYAVGQDWKVDNLISQGDANDSFRLPYIGPTFSLIVFNIIVPEKSFHRQNEVAAKWVRYIMSSLKKILLSPI